MPYVNALKNTNHCFELVYVTNIMIEIKISFQINQSNSYSHIFSSSEQYLDSIVARSITRYYKF